MGQLRGVKGLVGPHILAMSTLLEGELWARVPSP